MSFVQQQIGIPFFATYSDVKASNGLQDAMPTVATEWQADKIQFQHIMRASFSSRMFPGENATIRAENKRMFAEDVRIQCQKIYTDVHTLYAGDIIIITSKMPKIIQATLDCYSG